MPGTAVRIVSMRIYGR